MSTHEPQPKTKGDTGSLEWVTPLVFAVILFAYIVGAAVILLGRPN